MYSFNGSEKQRIRQHFNRAAETYDQAAKVQCHAGIVLIERTSVYLTTAHSLIDLGCGSGHVTEQLAKKMSYENFYAIDIAEKLLNKAQQKLHPYNIVIQQNDFENFHYPNINFDLVFSNMALHWSFDFKKTLWMIHCNLSEQGLLAFSLPLQGTFAELQTDSKNNFHATQTLLPWLHQCGFQLLSHAIEIVPHYFSSPMMALASLKETGVNSVLHVEHKGLHGKSFQEKLFSSPFEKLTYRIGYFIARKIPYVA